MGNIILVNGPFSAGKTELANRLAASFNVFSEARIADGPHLVDLVKERAHGRHGRTVSACHFHSWNQQQPQKPHNHFNGEKHFPFTVISPSIGEKMFLNFGQELLEASQGPATVIAELGTGVRGDCEVSLAEFSTEYAIGVLKRKGLWSGLRNRIKLVITAGVSWETRRERNGFRKKEADGVNESWEMAAEGLMITQWSDFSPWYGEGLKVLPFDNESPELWRIDHFIANRVVPAIEGSRRGVERY